MRAQAVGPLPIPIHYKACDGNQTDDATHWETWQALCRLLGKSDFIHVADSKLCVRETLFQIDGQKGRFVTILPEGHPSQHPSASPLQALCRLRAQGIGPCEQVEASRPCALRGRL